MRAHGTHILWNWSHGVDRADFLSNALDVGQVAAEVVRIHIWYARIRQIIVYRSARSSSIHCFHSHHHTTTQSINNLTNQQHFQTPITQPNSIKMKFSLAIAASMAASTMATPIFGKHWTEKWGHKWGNNKDEGMSSRPCDQESLHQTASPS